MTARCLAVIPARGGSRRISRKNARLFRGLPLIVHTIRAAKESDAFDAIVVSTDDEEIARMASDEGADVPFTRPASISDDHTPSSTVTVHAIESLEAEGTQFDFVAQLLPSCPLRSAADVAASRSIFSEDPDRPLITLTQVFGGNPWWLIQMNGTSVVRVLPDAWRLRSQDLPLGLVPSGAVWWTTTAQLKEVGTFHADQMRGYELPFPHGLDIDTELDWLVLEGLASFD